MPLILPGNVASATAEAYDVANSCRFDAASSAYLSRTQSSGSTTKFTYSAWMKRSTFGDSHDFLDVYDDGDNRFGFFWSSDDHIDMYNKISGSLTFNKITTAVYRDPSAWYNVIIAADTTLGTAEDRVKLWVNGVRVTSFGTNTIPDEDGNFSIHSSDDTQKIGAYGTSGSDYDGYMAEVFWIDGTAYANTDFGEFNSDSPTIWQPKDCKDDLTFGTNGFYLDFEDSGDLGDDESGNTNDFAETNLAATDQATDSPTNNFATLNSLYKSGVTFAEGNTQADNQSSDFTTALSTIGVANGKWYAEFKVTDDAAGVTRNAFGVCDAIDGSILAEDELGYQPTGAVGDCVGWASGQAKKNGSNVSDYDSTYTINDIISVALDCDNGKVYFAKNGTWENSGDPTSGATGTGAISITTGETYLLGGTVYNSTYQANFGNPTYANSSSVADGNGYGAFEYAPPSGYLALCTKNLGSDGG
jgi:hypothetical protein